MVDPYRMVVFNIILLLLLTVVTIVFKVLFPKKKIPYLKLLLLISCLPLVSILRKGTYESGALSEYVKLTYNFYLNLQSGVLFPQWAPYLCGLYGCPDFIFMYQFPYYVVSLLHTIGFSLIASVKIMLALTYITSGLFMYYLAREFMQKQFAFTAAILYLFAPYHLVNLHFQVDIAEMTSFVFIPACFLTGYKLLTKKSLTYFFLYILCVAGLILSHPVVSVSTIPFLLLFGIIIWYQNKTVHKKELFLFFTGIGIGLLLTAYYLIPAMLDSKYILWGIKPETTLTPLIMMLFSPWKYSFLYQGPIGQLSFFLGFAHWIIIIFCGVYLLQNRKQFKSHFLLLYFFVSFLLIFLGIQEIAAPIWKNTTVLKSFQMTYRLLVLIAFFTALMGGLLLSKLNKKHLWIIITIIAISTTILNWGNRRTIPTINDEFLINEVKNKPSGLDPTTPKWTKYDKKHTATIPKQRLVIINGKGTIKEISFTPTKRIYIIDADTNLSLKDNTFYYPGWNLYVNNTKHIITYENKEHPGLILYELKQGLHYVELQFEQTTTRLLARIISLITLLGLLLTAMVLRVKKYKI